MMRARDPEVLRKVIAARGLSYRDLGRFANCSHTTPYLLLRGKSTRNGCAELLARVLGRPVEELFEAVASNVEQDMSKQEAVA